MKRIHRLFAAGASSALLMLALAPAALAEGSLSAGSGNASASGAGTKYKGRTSQRKSISFRVGAGKAHGVIAWKALCGGKARLKGGTEFTAKYRNHRFHIKGSYKAPINGGQYQGHYTASITGHVLGSKARGTFTLTAGVYKHGKRLATCHTGKVTWHAHKA